MDIKEVIKIKICRCSMNNKSNCVNILSNGNYSNNLDFNE